MFGLHVMVQRENFLILRKLRVNIVGIRRAKIVHTEEGGKLTLSDEENEIGIDVLRHKQRVGLHRNESNVHGIAATVPLAASPHHPNLTAVGLHHLLPFVQHKPLPIFLSFSFMVSGHRG